MYDNVRGSEYVNRGRFDTFAALSFPDADPSHLETCLAFFYWAFAVWITLDIHPFYST